MVSGIYGIFGVTVLLCDDYSVNLNRRVLELDEWFFIPLGFAIVVFDEGIFLQLVSSSIGKLRLISS